MSMAPTALRQMKDPNTNPNRSSPTANGKMGSARSMVAGPHGQIVPPMYHPAAKAIPQVRGETGQGMPLMDFHPTNSGYLM